MTHASGATSAFLLLPAEIPNSIYAHIFSSSPVLISKRPRTIGTGHVILLNCRQCFKEAHQLFYSSSTFRVYSPFVLSERAARISRYTWIKWIRHLQVRKVSYTLLHTLRHLPKLETLTLRQSFVAGPVTERNAFAEITDTDLLAMVGDAISSHIDGCVKADQARKLYDRLKRQDNVSIFVVMSLANERRRSDHTVSTRPFV
jgi:hypothetical protein